MSKAEITRRCREILRRNPWERPLSCDDATFALDLLENHPEFAERTGGRDNVCWVTTGQADHGTVCFYVSRCDRPRPLVKVSYVTSLDALGAGGARAFAAEPHGCSTVDGRATTVEP